MTTPRLNSEPNALELSFLKTYKSLKESALSNVEGKSYSLAVHGYKNIIELIEFSILHLKPTHHQTIQLKIQKIHTLIALSTLYVHISNDPNNTNEMYGEALIQIEEINSILDDLPLKSIDDDTLNKIGCHIDVLIDEVKSKLIYYQSTDIELKKYVKNQIKEHFKLGKYADIKHTLLFNKENLLTESFSNNSINADHNDQSYTSKNHM